MRFVLLNQNGFVDRFSKETSLRERLLLHKNKFTASFKTLTVVCYDERGVYIETRTAASFL